MAPSHCGVLLGISATIANLSGIISPALTGFIVTNKVSLAVIIIIYGEKIRWYDFMVYWILISQNSNLTFKKGKAPFLSLLMRMSVSTFTQLYLLLE